MSICINVTPNLHLSIELLEEVNKNWSLGVVSSGTKTNRKKIIIEQITKSLTFAPYIRVFLVRVGKHIHPLPGSKPTKPADVKPIGVTQFINKARREPKSIPPYVNDVNIKRSGDVCISGYYTQLLSNHPPPVPAIMSLDEDIMGEHAGQLDETLLSSMESLSFDFKEEDFEAASPQDNIIKEETKEMSSASAPVKTQLNAFDIKAKCELPKFDPQKTTTEGWVDSSVFALELGGITDPKKVVSHLMLALDPKLQPSIQSLLIKERDSATPPKEISVEIFKKALKTIAGKSTNDLDMLVDNLSFNKGSYRSMREFYIDLERYLKDLNPDIDSDVALAKLTSRAFKKKVPVEIRTAPAFQMSDKTGVDLADLAQTLYSNLRHASPALNAFSAFKPYQRKTVTFKDNRPQYTRQNAYRRAASPRPAPTSAQTFKRIKCFYCSKLGHKKSECRKLTSDIRSRGNRRQFRKQ